MIATYAVSDIKVKVKDGTELKERTFFALSRGLGFMFDVTKSDTPFRAGILWGRDRIGSNNVDVYPHVGRLYSRLEYLSQSINIPKESRMSTFILIHGAWHGAWCWHKVIALLQDQGHTVLAPDLPALGVDRTPLHSASLQAYADRVCETLDACGEAVHLVGHSMGGIAITQAAEAMPKKVKTLVYLTAFLLPSGRSLIEEAQTDAAAEVLPNLIFAPDKSWATVKPEAMRAAFYADCSSSDVALARSLLVPQAAAPFTTPVQTTADRWGSIPRVYIECTEDRAISLAAQRAMYTQLPCQRIITMTSSHSPFLSAPDALSQHLLSL